MDTSQQDAATRAPSGCVNDPAKLPADSFGMRLRHGHPSVRGSEAAEFTLVVELCMTALRGIMSGIYTKAEEWGYWPEGRRNPMSRVKIGEKWTVRPERIFTEDETVKVLARLSDPNLLIIETALATGARISEILGLTWQHIDLKDGVIRIVQRNWRGDIDDPKSKTSKRPLTLGNLADRYRVKATADNAQPDKWVFARTDGSGLPLWDSGVRQALKKAAAAEGCDFPGLGPHSLRRAYITWVQEAGGSIKHRGVEDGWPQHGTDHRGIHEDPTQPAS
ncbi:MAG: tyrosine-type recombinase/integrase [Acidobacteriia bacterium]|nr:tyrosine-type recombinase/integrase [Terriglobia bacterium]